MNQDVRTMEVQNILVRKSLVVNAPAAHAFTVFTERFNTWWPRSHHIGGGAAFNAIIEPRAGGRWFERADDGSECNWGSVLAWEPPTRLLLSWDLGVDWKYDPNLATEVEVKFIAEAAERTRIEFEHRKLERYGDKAEAMRDTFNSPGGWTAILDGFVKAAEAKTA